MLSLLKYFMLFRHIYLQQEAFITNSQHVEQPCLCTASAEHPGEGDVAAAEPTGNRQLRECSQVPYA